MNLYSVETTVAKSSLDSHKLVIFAPSVLSGVNRAVTSSKYSVANQTLCSFLKELEWLTKNIKLTRTPDMFIMYFSTLWGHKVKKPPFCRNNLYAIVLVKGLYKQSSWFSLVSTGKITYFLPFLVLVLWEESDLGLSWENTDRKSWTGIKSSCTGGTLLHQ